MENPEPVIVATQQEDTVTPQTEVSATEVEVNEDVASSTSTLDNSEVVSDELTELHAQLDKSLAKYENNQAALSNLSNSEISVLLAKLLKLQGLLAPAPSVEAVSAANVSTPVTFGDFSKEELSQSTIAVNDIFSAPANVDDALANSVLVEETLAIETPAVVEETAPVVETPVVVEETAPVLETPVVVEESAAVVKTPAVIETTVLDFTPEQLAALDAAVSDQLAEYSSTDEESSECEAAIFELEMPSAPSETTTSAPLTFSFDTFVAASSAQVSEDASAEASALIEQESEESANDEVSKSSTPASEEVTNAPEPSVSPRPTV